MAETIAREKVPEILYPFRLERFKTFDLVNEMGAERYHLVGWNGGAQIALQATQEHPQRLASLTLLSPFRAWGECRQVEKGIEFIELFLRSGRRDLYVWYWFMAGLSDSYVAENFG